MSWRWITARLRSRAATSQSGVAVLEYAMALAVLMPIILGIFDLGRACFYYVELANAANEGARFATTNRDVTAIVNVTRIRAGALSLSTNDVTVTCYSGATATTKACGSVGLYDTIDVAARHAFTPITPVLFNATNSSQVMHRCPTALGQRRLTG
jgi:Flp pilus assembly protein TadG